MDEETGVTSLTADARVARTGIQAYSGAEVGRPDLAQVKVYRPAESVFSATAMASAAHKPITVDHPSVMVDASRWKELAAGWTSEAVARDGEYLRVPMMIADQAAIASIESGARELSCGYTCDLTWAPGTTPAGEAYDAVQRSIIINHVALVPKGRAGSECRIGDSAQLQDVTLGDAIVSFMDSAEGRAAIAHAEMKHKLGVGNPNRGGAPFTDSMKQAVAARALADRAASQQAVAAAQSRLPVLQAEAATARALMIDRMQNAYRGGQS